MKTQRWVLGLAILACNVAIVAPRAKSAIHPKNSFKADTRDSDKGFRQKSDNRTLDLEVGKVAARVRLNVLMRVPEGVMRFRLLDPKGEERLQGEVREGNGTFDTREIPAIAGTWKLTLERENASGNYEANWRVR